MTPKEAAAFIRQDESEQRCLARQTGEEIHAREADRYAAVAAILEALPSPEASGPDRSATWDRNAAAHSLFGPDGGMAIWVRAEEVAPRACVRSGGDLVKVVTQLGSMHLGFELLSEGLREKHGVPPHPFAGMVGHAIDVLRPKMEHAVRIRPKGGGG